MRKVGNELKGIDIDIELTDAERALLSSFIKQEGFDILQRILEDIVRKFNLRLLCTSAAKPELVLANHNQAQAMGQLYTSFVERLAVECQIAAYNNTPVAPPTTDIHIEELQ